MFKKMKKPFWWLLATLLLGSAVPGCFMKQKDPVRVLVFSRTMGFRHNSIPDGVQMIRGIGQQLSFEVDTTEDASKFTEENLKRYAAVVFMSTTGNVLNRSQQNDFERYIQAGGNFVGIHAATDTEYDWPWYNQLVGAQFASHPAGTPKAMLNVLRRDHPATEGLPERWERTDEWYNFKSLNTKVNVLMTIDEKTYEGGTNGDNHPMCWYHEFDGGRAFYTAGGHTKESFTEPLFVKHVTGGFMYALGERKPLDYTKARTKREIKPEENRFTKVVLENNLDEPTELAVLPDGKVLYVHRKGEIRLYSPTTNKTKKINLLKVHTKHEDGLMGLALDPGFAQNKWVYLYYSPMEDKVNRLSRFDFRGDSLVLASEKRVLDVPTQRDECCHTGGSLAFDGKGNLFLSTGDNTNPFASEGYSPADERPGRAAWDAQRTSANTNDLRGKVLRVRPRASGGYDIPEGNLFAPGTPNTRPEIYVMGCRNPYRISVDKKTGFLYWGDVGPDAGEDSTHRGPRGHCEVNQAQKPGFYGWPLFVADSKPYRKFDFGARTSGEAHNPDKPINSSPNNTGLRELPPVQKPMIWYPYTPSAEFPIVGKGGRNPMAGEVFYLDRYKKSARTFPSYYDGKLFIYEWMRGWIMVVSMDQNGKMTDLEPFMPGTKFNNPMDMEFAPDGSLYMLEYGTNWFSRNEDARLVRIDFNAGNRKPVVAFAPDKPLGAAPLTVQFDSKGTKDYDGDKLTYAWKFTGGQTVQAKDANPKFTFTKPGVYTVSLTVTDAKGASNTTKEVVKVGNSLPQVALKLTGNQTFYFDNQARNYEVTVTDPEDAAKGGIAEEDIAFRVDFLEQGYDKTAIAQGHQVNSAATGFVAGKRLIEESDCRACHSVDKKSVGPTYVDIAQKYKKDGKAVDYLSEKIIKGGAGVWGSQGMAAHPQLTAAQTAEMARYILSLADEKKAASRMPTKGTYTLANHVGKGDQGSYLISAAYTDRGANGIEPLTSQQALVLRSPKVKAVMADAHKEMMKFNFNGTDMAVLPDGAHLVFKDIDLTGIQSIGLVAAGQGSGGEFTLHTGSPTGPAVGKAVMEAKGGMQMLSIDTKGQAGVHDLYLVNKITKVEGQPFLALISLEFKQ
jgi:cytochrome c